MAQSGQEGHFRQEVKNGQVFNSKVFPQDDFQREVFY